MAGFKEMQIVSSQSPRKRLDPDSQEGRNQIQQTVDSLAEVFISAMARNRGVTVEKVLSDFGGGGVLVGRAAVDAGLADKLGSFEEGLAELSAPESPFDAGMKKKKKEASAEEKTNPISAADDEGEEMNFKKFFGLMSEEDRKEAAAALGTTVPEGNTEQTTSPAKPDASTQAASEELERVRKEAAAKDDELRKMRAEQRTSKVDAYVKAQLEANKILPAEEAALREEYLQALVDDEQHPVAAGAISRAARVEARQEARPAHILTEETLKADLPKGAAVLASKESEDPIAQARAQAEKYAEERNQACRRGQYGTSSSLVN
jgi:hypothetical protein